MVNIHVDSSYFRVALRAYFILATLLVGLIGDSCCHLRTKLRLLQGRNVNVVDMTGWLRGLSSWRVAIYLRRLPGGWLGALMLFTALLAIGADLGTAFVTDVGLQSRCPFKQGLVLGLEGIHYFPSYYGAAYRWASQAQDYSADNLGYVGIYPRVDSSPLFSAELEDTIAWWQCDLNGQPVDFNDTLDTFLWTDLYHQDLLYDYGQYTNVSILSAPGNGSSISTGRSWETVIMTANTTEIGGIFDIKIAIEVQDTPDNQIKTMQAYWCYINWDNGTGAAIIPQIVSTIDIQFVINNWIHGFQGLLYDGTESHRLSSNQPNYTIAWMLNSIVMVAGARESITSPGAPGDTEGCIYYGTKLPNGVLALVALVAVLVLSLAIYATTLYISLQTQRKRYDIRKTQKSTTNATTAMTSRQICDNTPNDLLNWMAYSVYASNVHVDKKPKAHRLGTWYVHTNQHSGTRLGISQQQHSDSVFDHSRGRPDSLASDETATSTLMTPVAAVIDQSYPSTAKQGQDHGQEAKFVNQKSMGGSVSAMNP